MNEFQLNDPPMTFGEWFLTLLLTAIPLVGFILLLVWAFSGSTNLNKKNWAKANLLWMLISTIVCSIIMFAVLANM